MNVWFVRSTDFLPTDAILVEKLIDNCINAF